MINTNQLTAILQTIQGVGPSDLQTADQCVEYMAALSGMLAYTAEQMALTEKALNIAKRDAYARLQQDFAERKINLSPMLAKDYIGSLISKEAYAYTLAERANRTVTHTLEAMRSILSSKKSEREFARYNQ